MTEQEAVMELHRFASANAGLETIKSMELAVKEYKAAHGPLADKRRRWLFELGDDGMVVSLTVTRSRWWKR